MDNLHNTRFLVVGASSGIGRRTAELLVERGAEVYVWSRRPPESEQLRNSSFSEVDVTQDIAGQSPEIPDSLDGLCYAPGSINLSPFPRLKPEGFAEDYNLNVVGAVRVIQSVLDALISGDGASIVMFSTVAARVGMNFHASIASAKAGVEGLAKSLAAEYAGKNVRCNVVAPSLTDTPLASRLLSSDKKREAAAQRHPLSRVGTPDDIAEAACYLLSPAGSWVTGQTIGVDGGLGSTSGL